MKTLRGVIWVVALAGVSVGAAMAQGRPSAPTVESAPLAKKGYDHYTAQSDTASARLRTRPGVVYAWSSVQVVHEADSVSATGKRMHKPFVITKEIDSSSPTLAALAVSHEPIPELTLTLDGASKDAAKSASSGAGAGKAMFQDLSIVSVKKVSAKMEEVTMSYDKITWTWTGGSSSHDDWSK